MYFLLLLILLWAVPVGAFDSNCTIPGGEQCRPGPETAQNSWVGPSDEHRLLWESTRELAGLPPEVSFPFELKVFTDGSLVAGTTLDSMRPVPFRDARDVKVRSKTIGEFAQLPNFSYALWDWATGNETCPLDDSLPAPANPEPCHDLAKHMGPVNSNHFLPQAQRFYVYYRTLALKRAGQCRQIKRRSRRQRARFAGLGAALLKGRFRSNTNSIKRTVLHVAIRVFPVQEETFSTSRNHYQSIIMKSVKSRLAGRSLEGLGSKGRRPLPYKRFIRVASLI